MRIFTLGKMRVPLLFFALFLFSGTYSYGQENCPTVADDTQEFCYLSTVADLVATAGGDDVRWYRTATSTNPIPQNEFLQDGRSYFAGNASRTCNSRIEVVVAVDATPAPQTEIGSVFAPCIESEENLHTVNDLETIFTAIDGFEIVVFSSQFGSEILSETTTLVPGQSYYVGQQQDEACPSLRVPIAYNPDLTEAPTAIGEQTFCEGATVADLVATGTSSNTTAIRWYSDDTSYPPLDPSTPLLDGEVFYASQIINDRNSPFPPCESEDRVAVTVTVTPAQELETTGPGIICELDVQETFPSVDAIRNYYLSLLGEGVPTNGTFNPTPAQLAAIYQADPDGLGDFTTTYTVGCDQIALTATIIASEEANAGADVAQTYDITQGPQDLYGLISGGQTIGTFEGYPDGMFDPSAEGAGVYTIDYIVDETSGCIVGSDTATFTITVAPCEANAGEDVDEVICQSEAIQLQNEIAADPLQMNAIFIEWLGERDTDGTFEGDLSGLSRIETGPFPIDIIGTYTVGTGICEETANIAITIVEDVNAGESTSITLDPDDAPVNLFNLLGEDAEEGGTWNSGNGIFDPATDAPGTYTYTVGEGCTDSADVVVTVTTEPTVPTNPGTATPGYTIVCEADVQTFFPSVDEIRKFYLRLLPTGVARNGTLNPTASQLADLYQADPDGLGEFTSVYTVNGESYELTVNIVTEAEAGDNNTVTLTTEDEPVDLFDYLGEDALRGGTWSSGNGTFDPATDEGGTFTYTVGYEGCMDSATVTVVVNDSTDPTPTDPGTATPGYTIVCEADVQAFFPSVDEIRKFYLRLLPTGVARNGTLNPTASQLADLYQADPDGLGEFTSVYTVNSESYELTVNIVTEAEAGDDATVELTTENEPVDLFDYLGEDALPGGTWSTGNGTFDPATDEGGTFTYTVGYEGCMDSATVIVNVTDPTDPTPPGAGAGVVCLDDVQTVFPSVDEIRKYYLGLLPAGAPTGGTLNPTAAQLADIYQADEDGLGEFTSVYTVNGESYELTVNIVTEAEAGDDATVELTTEDEPVDLFNYLGEDALPGGTWSTGDGTFDPATDQAGSFTYTVGYEGCMDSATVMVNVTDPTDPTPPGVGAGVICLDDVQTVFPSVDEIRKYYLGLLPAGAPSGGTLNPTAAQLADIYQADEDGLGEFTSVYTVNGESYELTVNIVTEAEAGDDATVELTTEDEPVDLFDYLGEDALPGGTWSSGDGTFDPATDQAGSFTYTVGYEGCMDSATVMVNVTDPTDPTPPGVGAGVICLDDVQTVFPSVDEIRKYYLGLLPAGAPSGGTLNPTAAQLADIYQADEDGLGEFTSVYTVNGESYELTVNIVTEAEAGDDATVELTTEDEPVDLFDYLGEDALPGGTWSSGNGTFDPATDEEGTFTYTVGYEGCMDTATVTVSVTDSIDPCEGVVDAGTDTSVTICETDVDEDTFSDVEALTNFYLVLLDPEVATTGTFNPTPAELLTQFANDDDGLGEFSTTYTLTEGECTDSVVLTVNIVPIEQANAGTIEDFDVCAGETTLDLFAYLADDSMQGGTFFDADGNEITGGALDISVEGDYTITYIVNEDDSEACVSGSDSTEFTVMVTENTANAGADSSRTICNSEVRNLSTAQVRNLYLNLLETGVVRTGTFNPTIEQIIDQYNSQSNFGDFVTTYTVGTGDCTDSAVLTVTVLENPNAGQSTTVNLEEDSTDTVDLFAELGDNAEAGGTWTFNEEEVEATFDPATDEEGVYTYMVTSENGCSASATVTVVIGTEEPNCPEVTETEQIFCSGAPTVADLAPAGVLWYSSASGTDALDVTTALVDGTVYFAGPVDGTCDDRPSVAVILSDNPVAPTVSDFTACLSDNSTVADLDITGEDGATFSVFSNVELTESVAETAELTEGTYYVTQTNASGCVSEAATIAVTLNDADTPTLETDGNVFCEFDGATIADLQENVSGTGTITWYASATGSQTVPQTTVLQNNATYYAASADATTGCESSQRLPVTVRLEVCEIVIPDAFSPNGDQINDRFEILNLTSEYPNHKMEIYNRWGDSVYEGQAGDNQGWDGTSSEGSFGSGVLPAGVYFYILYFNDGQTSPTQGRVYLSR